MSTPAAVCTASFSGGRSPPPASNADRPAGAISRQLVISQGRALADRDYQIDKLRSEAEAARLTEGDLRNEIAATSGRSSIASDKFRSDIKQLEAQLASALDERAKLQRELATMKRDAEETWASPAN